MAPEDYARYDQYTQRENDSSPFRHGWNRRSAATIILIDNTVTVHIIINHSATTYSRIELEGISRTIVAALAVDGVKISITFAHGTLATEITAGALAVSHSILSAPAGTAASSRWSRRHTDSLTSANRVGAGPLTVTRQTTLLSEIVCAAALEVLAAAGTQRRRFPAHPFVFALRSGTGPHTPDSETLLLGIIVAATTLDTLTAAGTEFRRLATDPWISALRAGAGPRTLDSQTVLLGIIVAAAALYTLTAARTE